MYDYEPNAKKKSQQGVDLLVVERGERTPEFWSLMGPFFASEKVHRNLPTLHDEPGNDMWFIALKLGTVQSFSCLRFGGKSATLCHHWAEEGARDKGIAAAMMDARLDAARAEGVKKLRSVVHNDSVEAFVRQGFTPTITRARFTTVEMTLE